MYIYGNDLGRWEEVPYTLTVYNYAPNFSVLKPIINLLILKEIILKILLYRYYSFIDMTFKLNTLELCVEKLFVSI